MRSKLFSIVVFLALAMAALPLAAHAEEPTDGGAPAHVAGRALVGVKAHGRDDAKTKIQARGGRVVSYYEPGDFFVVETPGNAPDWVKEIRGDESVAFAELDYELTADVIPNDTYISNLWGMTKIGAPAAWDTQTGSASVVVGVIDTGVAYNHPDLAGQMWTNPGETAGNGLDDEDTNDYVDDVHGINCINNSGNPMDDNDHGTHVSGTIGAVGNNGIGVAGVNWDVSIMALKFLGSDGRGSTSDAVECLDYATQMGVHLTNNSWGGGGFSTALSDAISRARTAGDLFVAAAGNSSANTDSSPHYPSSYNLDNVISVASTTSGDALSSFSNYGPTSVDLAAPGSSILSTVKSGGYASFSGTSMATPHVAGAAALLWAENSSLTGPDVRNAIFSTVDPLASLNGKVVTGGRLNVAAAIASLGPPPPPPPLPDAPTLQSATASSHTQIDLVWSDVADESSYKIKRSPTGAEGSWTLLGTNAADDTTFSNTGLEANATWYYQVIANNITGDSDASNSLSATTPAAPPVVTVHVGDLDGSGANTNGRKWRATVTILVHNSNEVAVSGAGVSVLWSTGQTSSCTTGAAGTCSLSSSSLSRWTTSVSASVTGVSHALGYVSDDNHDIDFGTDGTTIVVTRP
jgi:thermitase